MPQTSERWTVVCDFDGTISTDDATDRLFEAFAEREWLDIEAAWQDGKIGSRECLGLQVELLRARLADIVRLADTIEIDPHFKTFVEFCHRRGVALVVVSDGFDRMIRRILPRNGIGALPVFCNRLLATGRQQYRMTSPHRKLGCHADAATCKCAVVDSWRAAAAGTKVLFVGDGRSDFCVAQRAVDVVAAKSELLTHLRKIGVLCFPFATFADVRKLLGNLLSSSHVSSNSVGEVLHERT